MGAPFVKLAANLHGNRKVMQAGRNGRDVFVFVLCQNSMVDGDGSVSLSDMEPWYLARHLQCSEDEARDGFERCVTVGLLSVTGDRVLVVGWDDEWSRRPLTDAERAARYRERKKSSHESRPERDESRDESRGVTSHVGEESRGEERRGEEKREEPPNPPKGGSSRKSRKSDFNDIERAQAMRVIASLNQYSESEYRGADVHVGMIVARLREGKTVLDLRKVAWHCALGLGWATKHKEKMGTYLRPETLFGPQNIEKYLDPALSAYRKQFGTDEEVSDDKESA